MTRPKPAARPNRKMAALYLDLMEAATALADGHRRLATERLGARGALRLRLLALLSAGMDGRAPTELAARMRMAKTTLLRVLGDLHDQGLIEWGAVRGDARCKSVWITDIGQIALEEMTEALNEDLAMLADMANLQMFAAAQSATETLCKKQATYFAYRNRGPRRKPTFG